MAVRNRITTAKGLIWTFQHPDMPTFNKGDRVKFDDDDQLLDVVDETDVAESFGHVYQQNGTSVEVLMDGHSIVEVRIAEGATATRGGFAVMTDANLYDDAPTLGGGDTLIVISGRFMGSGIAGDYVPMMVGGVNIASFWSD